MNHVQDIVTECCTQGEAKGSVTEFRTRSKAKGTVIECRTRGEAKGTLTWYCEYCIRDEARAKLRENTLVKRFERVTRESGSSVETDSAQTV